MITLQTAIRVKDQYESGWLRLSNEIVSIGIGMDSGEYVIVVGVSSLNRFATHQSDLSAAIRIPSKVCILSAAGEEEIRVVFREVGEFSAFNTTRQRPCPGGYSVGHTGATGTFGCLVSFRGGPLSGRKFILSNNHVIANSNDANVGDRIYQPGPVDLGSNADRIATLTRWVPLISDGENYVDAAIAEVEGGTTGWSELVATYVKDIGVPSGATLEPVVGMHVEKSGRTTGHTAGRVEQVGVTARVSYRDSFPAPLVFRDQILLSPMSRPGDSGSVVFRASTREAIGLLFAGSERATLANRINLVLSQLTHRSVFRLGDGSNIAFDETPPLQLGIEGGAVPHVSREFRSVMRDLMA
jgi:hypothetical protein